jgi:L-lactate dehydrogenase complex protein LldG
MNNSATNQSQNNARAAILTSIREHLAESAPHNLSTREAHITGSAEGHSELPISHGTFSDDGNRQHLDLVEQFRERLESVGGHCIVARDEAEAKQLLTSIIRELQTDKKLRVAFSDAPRIEALTRALNSEVAECAVGVNADELFGFDVGITAAQCAIAETGTLVLESDRERHRLVSLVPPAHIAVIKAADICETLGDALKHVRSGALSDLSRTITFITGPSRTADIELTLTIGVHGPKELYVIVCRS